MTRRPSLLARAKAAKQRLARAWATRRQAAELKRQVAGLQPRERRAMVVITGLSPGGLNGPGKVDAGRFFPPFCQQLAQAGIATVVATSLGEVRAAVAASGPTIIVNVYREVEHRIDLPAMTALEDQATAVFNRSTTGPLIADKLRTNEFLTGHGVAMPSLAPSAKVFSNSRNDTAAPVSVLDSIEAADPARYNTGFIDTRVAVGGRTYHTCVRLLCVGTKLIHAYVRARDVEEGSPSVHAVDTPLDPGLVELLQRRLVEGRLPEHAALAERVAAALGPGFYAHDVLLDREGGPPLLCETGFKFQDGAYERRLLPIAEQLPSHRILFSPPELAQASARLFVDECVRLGVL
jgi:hypothetical protein